MESPQLSQDSHCYLRKTILVPAVTELNGGYATPVEDLVLKSFKLPNSTKKTKNSKVKQCRICLEDEQEGRMIRPCQCSGSISYVHQKCILQWIKRKHGSKQTFKVACQMCSTPFQYKCLKSRKLDLKEIAGNYEKYTTIYHVFFSALLLFLIMFVGALVILVESDSDSELGMKIRETLVRQKEIKIVYMSLVTLILTIILLTIAIFVTEFGIRQEILILEIRSYQQRISKRIPNSISPMAQQDNITPI